MRGNLPVAIMAAMLVAFQGTAAATQQPPPPQPPRAPAASAAPAPGWLGIAFRYEVEQEGEARRERAVVGAVHPGSPAERAGLQRGDTILRVNGRTEVQSQVRGLRLQPGDTVRLRVRRPGERDRDIAVVAESRPRGTAMREGMRLEVPGRGGPRTIIINGDTVRIPVDSIMAHADSLQRRFRVLLADSLGPRLRELEEVHMPQLRERLRMLDTTMVHAFPEGFVFEVGRRAVAGAEFSELNPELAEYFQGAREGLLVLRVAPESPAARAGLQAGDIVVSANGQAVRNTAELRRVVGRAAREEVRLGVVRKGRQHEVRMR